MPLVFGNFFVVVIERGDKAFDRRERRAQLMRDERNKIRLHLIQFAESFVGFHEIACTLSDFFFERQIRLAERFVKAGILDGNRGLRGVHRVKLPLGFTHAQGHMRSRTDNKSNKAGFDAHGKQHQGGDRERS